MDPLPFSLRQPVACVESLSPLENVINDVGCPHSSTGYSNQRLIREYPQSFDIVGIERYLPLMTHPSHQGSRSSTEARALQLLHRPIHIGSGEILHVELIENSLALRLPRFGCCAIHDFHPCDWGNGQWLRQGSVPGERRWVLAK
jgi:hypothetical protein